MDFASIGTPGFWGDFLKVIAIDLVLAGDNVVVVGALAAGLPADQRRKVIGYGVGIALAFLIGFAFLATTLLKLTGVLFAGGLLLLWICWKLLQELRHQGGAPEQSTAPAARPPKSFASTIVRVALADLSMSLDNVLAVAGAARAHPVVLFFGLALSVTLMGVAANAIARVIERHHWIAYLGLAVILYVAGDMIHQGLVDPETGVLPYLRR